MTKMKISYKRLRILMVEQNIDFATLRKATEIGSSTMTKIKRDEEVAMSVLLRICEHFCCNIGDICDVIPVKESENE